MHPGENSEPSPQAQRAITRELWLVRDPSIDDETAEILGESSQVSRRGFDWIDIPTPYAHHESPAVIAEFQRCLRDAAARRAELQVALDEEDLRASRVANRLNEEALSKAMKQRSRASTVRYVRSIVLLVALAWMLAFLCLSTIGRPVNQLTPGALIRDATKLIDGVEAAIGVQHPAPPAGGATAEATIANYSVGVLSWAIANPQPTSPFSRQTRASPNADRAVSGG
jgi:hypothetical protein